MTNIEENSTLWKQIRIRLQTEVTLFLSASKSDTIQSISYRRNLVMSNRQLP